MSTSTSPPPTPSNAEFATLADANCIVLCLDSAGRILFLNPFGLTFFGYRDSEILGRPALGTIIPETDRAGVDLTAMVDRMLKRPEDIARQINENQRKNGERVWVVWSNRAFRDKTGKINRILCVGHDITDRKTFEAFLEEARVQLTATVQAQNTRLQETNERLRREIAEREKVQAALKASRDRYRLFSMVSSEGILFHEDGIAIEVNDAFAELVDCPRAQLIGMDIISHFVAPEDTARVRQRIASDEDFIHEINVRSATGRTFPVELRSCPGNIAGRRCRVVCVRDITHRKKTERQLIQSQKMEAIGTLASGIAHDFNNMLAGIQGNVEVIRHQLPAESPHHKGLNLISQIVQRGAKLSGQLLGYARSGKNEITEIDLNRLVDETVEMFGHTSRQITIRTRLDPKTPCISGDRTQIEQVLLNLMINGVQAMPEGGLLTIETRSVVIDGSEKRTYAITPGTFAMLIVEDTGCGMEPEIQKQIFEPFFTTKAEGQGTGLGLASTYGIIKNHKGYIDVTSEKEGGSRFSLLLPASACKEENKPQDTAVKRGTGVILIVDDEPEFLDLGRQMLEMLGYKPITAANGEEAAACLEAQDGSVKLVIMDMIMPGLPADQTIQRLRAVDPSLRVLLTSGHSQNGEIGRRLMPTCDGFIQKPFQLAALSQKVEELLGTVENEDP